MSDIAFINEFIRNNINTEYIKKLFILFKIEMGERKNISVFELMDNLNLRSKFIEWIRFNKDMGREYVNWIVDNVILFNNMTEIGKGVLDSNSIYFKMKNKSINVVSPYAYTFSKYNIDTFGGKLIYGLGEGYILGNDVLIPLSKLDTDLLVTTIPATFNEIDSMIKCAKDGYEILIGNYSDKCFSNYKRKIIKLEGIKNYIKSQTDLDVRDFNNNLGIQCYNCLYVKERKKKK